jgi:hypothetical protein
MENGNNICGAIVWLRSTGSLTGDNRFTIGIHERRRGVIFFKCKGLV